MQSATTTLLSTLLDQLGQRGRIAALRYGIETMSTKLLSDEATRDIFLALETAQDGQRGWSAQGGAGGEAGQEKAARSFRT